MHLVYHILAISYCYCCSYLPFSSPYLSIERPRDVIELPIDGPLDVDGWDVQKALRLLHKSNPALFEWSSSPIVYRSTPAWEGLRPLMGRCFSCRSGVHHYLHMAAGNYREYLKGERVRTKKCFYVIRPILACRWIVAHGAPPPVPFEELCPMI